MADIWFYHLERQPLELVLPRILAGLYARGERCCVHARDRSMLEDISKKLWTLEETAFVPHGFSSDPYTEQQPVLLVLEATAANEAAYRFYLEGTVPEQFEGVTRSSIFFEGRSVAAVEDARNSWKVFGAQGHAIKYWKLSDAGRWEDQAVRKAA
jgi:DNA polymerase III subunit chi